MKKVKAHHFLIRKIYQKCGFLFFGSIFFCSNSCSIENKSAFDRKGRIPKMKANTFDSYGDLKNVCLKGIRRRQFIELLSDENLVNNYHKKKFIEDFKASGYKLDYFEMSEVAPILFKILVVEPEDELAVEAANNLESLADGEWASSYDYYKALWKQSLQK